MTTATDFCCAGESRAKSTDSINWCGIYLEQSHEASVRGAPGLRHADRDFSIVRWYRSSTMQSECDAVPLRCRYLSRASQSARKSGKPHESTAERSTGASRRKIAI